uniref:Pyridoxal phosphate homeostasis protein n=1 Tax=Macrostomum lignano TaxID=282301 RepID=A0A1I8ITJ1_9PLAT
WGYLCYFSHSSKKCPWPLAAPRLPPVFSPCSSESLARLPQLRAARPSSSLAWLPCRKPKPISDIVAAYSAGQRHFGENYVQELYEKSHSPEIQSQCPDIRWHFIGHCQSKNVKRLSQVNNLDTMETVDSEKLANLLHKEWTKTSAYESGSQLRVFIQVNTSNEEQKYGCQPNQVVGLAGHLLENCPAISLAGLMTIGSLEASHQAEDGNADFERLVLCRRELTAGIETWRRGAAGAEHGDVIKMGSTNVRVGSTIFGERNYSK